MRYIVHKQLLCEIKLCTIKANSIEAMVHNCSIIRHNYAPMILYHTLNINLTSSTHTTLVGIIFEECTQLWSMIVIYYLFHVLSAVILKFRRGDTCCKGQKGGSWFENGNYYIYRKG